MEWRYHFPTMRAVSGYEGEGGTYGSQTEYLLRRTANGEWLLKASRFRKFGFEKVQMSAEEAPWERRAA